jgi:hypothetical protein
VQPLGVVHLLEEAREPGDDIGEGLVAIQMHLLVFEGLHEALRLGVVARVAAPPHRATKPVLGELLPVRLGSVLWAAIGMVETARRR